MGKLSDEETIDEMLLITPSEYGTYDAKNLAIFFKRESPANYLDEGALLRLGFVDVQYVSLPGDERNYTTELYTFNDRWRNLKSSGNYTSFIEWEQAEKEADRIKIQTEREFIRNQNEFQAANNLYMNLQSELINNQIATNEITRTTNILIAVFTGAAALWYLRDLAHTILLDYFPKGATIPAKLSNNAMHILTGGTIFFFLAETVAILYIILERRRANRRRTTT